MIVIDGSQGEGGGQILRSALTLSLVTGKPFRIENIRARRKKPGVMRQHVTAVNAAVAVGAAQVSGNAIGSPELTCIPTTLRSGDYHGISRRRRVLHPLPDRAYDHEYRGSAPLSRCGGEGGTAG